VLVETPRYLAASKCVNQTEFDIDAIGPNEELDGVVAFVGLAAMPCSKEMRVSTRSEGRRKQATRVGEELCSGDVSMFAPASTSVL
jgi:hypothetical protein